LVDEGDDVLIPTPYWVSFGDIAHYVGARTVFIPTREDDGFRLTAKMLEAAITPKSRMLIVNSPCNPSGAVIDDEEFVRIAALCRANNIWLLSDECYSKFLYDGRKPFSIASRAEFRSNVVIAGSLSKTYAMTGWRAGYALGPKAIIAAMSKLQSQSTSNTASMVQQASIAAVSGSQECVAEMRADYIKLRDRILEGFKTIPGLTCTVPQGAFYVYPNVKSFIGKGGVKSATDLAAKLLSEAHVVVVPGEAFGTSDHIRLSYAVSHDVVDEGVKRMREYFAKLG